MKDYKWSLEDSANLEQIARSIQNIEATLEEIELMLRDKFKDNGYKEGRVVG